jgi:hypothetical protein
VHDTNAGHRVVEARERRTLRQHHDAGGGVLQDGQKPRAMDGQIAAGSESQHEQEIRHGKAAARLGFG